MEMNGTLIAVAMKERVEMKVRTDLEQVRSRGSPLRVPTLTRVEV